MRYYHYRNNNSNVFTEEREKAPGSIYTAKDTPAEPHSSRPPGKSTLIIEDDTVYEIDEECMECRK